MNTALRALLALSTLAGSASAENWTQFRGPNCQGRSAETNVPVHWSAAEAKNVAWKADIPGEAWSSPIVFGQHVFLTTATDQGASCRVLALDLQTGDILWNREVFRQELGRKESRNSYATPTPATDGKRVYACFGEGSFAALDFQGNPVWTSRDYPFYSQHGLGSSPILYKDLLIMARDGSSDGEDKKLGWQTPWDQAYLIALDTTTGQEQWNAKRGLSRISHGTPAIVTDADGSAQVVSEAGDVVQGFNAETGERLWTSEVIGEGKTPSAVLGNGLVFTAGGWGGKETIKAFRLGGRGSLGESNLVWEQSKGMPKVPSMIFVDPHLFAISDNGVATCLDADAGKIVWQERIGGNFAASPVFADGQIYLVDDQGNTTVIEAASSLRIVAKNPLGEAVQASPAISQGRFLIRTATRLYCFGPPARN